ncbi:Cytosolic sulfotransferase 3 [Eumeta japonica]|uniref:Cytosolic sulfotransferase 3 n=1 Tax=Eumeta variegata TaxID=151549 RepID=A0A4C1Z819_EUMVA|nr:Cytosolic sulfotransferase 3 [Eumeta japonica]
MVMKGFQKADLKEFWEAFRRDLLPYAPIVEHANEAWLKRHDPNMLMLFYEDMIEHLPSQIRRVCQFLNTSYSEAQIQILAEHLNFDNLKKNKTVNSLSSDDNGKKNGNQFLRNGQSGSWVKHFDEKMVLQAEEYLTARLQNAEIIYPTVPPHIYETACSYL